MNQDYKFPPPPPLPRSSPPFPPLPPKNKQNSYSTPPNLRNNQMDILSTKKSSTGGLRENYIEKYKENYNSHKPPATWSEGVALKKGNEQGYNVDTSSSNKSSALLDSHDRFKPEKNVRRPVQKMKWTQSRWSRSLAGDLFSSNISQGTNNNKNSSNKNIPIHTGQPGLNEMTAQEFLNQFVPPAPLFNLPLESDSRVSSMTIADVSPRLAVKKVLMLYEHAQYKEAAQFIQRLSVSTFRIILSELPLEILVEAMPHSLPIMEALYTKVYKSDGPSVNLKPLKPESVLMHIVKFFSREELLRESSRGREFMGPFTSGCKEILRVIVLSDPKIMRILQFKKRGLDKGVEGMGQHGLVGTTDDSLLPLHDALKLEFKRVLDAYKGALQKLEDLSLSNKNNPKTVAHGPAPIQASHQRQLSLRAEEIQDRLIKNKSVLNLVEPTLDNHCLDILLGILQRRIECDKEALFQFTQIRKEAGDITPETVVAPLLMRYSRGCKQVLDMMSEIWKEVGDGALDEYEDDSSDLSGYHSDSDSAIMTSGNSPYVSPRARFNFLSRSVRCKTNLRASIMGSSSSGINSIGSRPRSALGSGISISNENNSPMSLMLHSNGPIRPRHIKQKSQLHKNNSLVSNASSLESDESSGRGSLNESLNSRLSSNNGLSCIDCVTVVSVPDDKVLTQGLNHRCVDNSKSGTVEELRNEVSRLRSSLTLANSTIAQLEQRNKINNGPDENGVPNAKKNVLQKEESARDYWIREYGALYAQARVDTMDALDALKELTSADELKSKLLFSVVVLSFRAVQTNICDIRKRLFTLLQIDSTGDGKSQNIQNKLLEVVGSYLGTSAQKFELTKAADQVSKQLWTTLYDYPCLKKCEGLLKYIATCVHLAWGLSNLTPPCVLEYETRTLEKDMHVRFHSSDPSNNTIKTYLWPALLAGPNGPCVHKGVVIT